MAFLDEVERAERKDEGGIPRVVLVGAAGVVAALGLVAVLGMALPGPGGVEVFEGAAAASKADEGNPSAGSSGGAETDADGGGAAAQAPPELCYVYVVGAVKQPGVYGLAPGSRVNDAVEAAGGLAEDAEPAAVNLARSIVDGEQVVVPRIGEVGEGPALAGGASDAASLNQASEAPGTSSVDASGKVNINTASAAELTTLKGVGQATAEKIIASRESEGPFTSPEDLKRVSGIGEKKYAALADSITV